MNPTFYSTFLLALVLSAVAGQDDGVCVKPQTFNQTLDTERYSGRWYLQLQIPAWFSPDGISCATANYEPNDEGDGEIVKNAQILPNNVYNEICGVAYVPDPEAPGELIVQLAIFPGGPYWLLDTDYDSFTSVYSCKEDEPLDYPGTYGWLLTREAAPSDEAIAAGRAAFEAQGIDFGLFRPVPQQGDVPVCQYERPDGQEPGAGCQD